MFRTRGKLNSGLSVRVSLLKSAIQTLAPSTPVFCLVLIATTIAFAQATDTTQIDAYLRAITQTDTTARLAALERFAAAAPVSNLRLDALEWIVWDEKQTHNDAAAATWAQQLLQADPGNALGMAVALEHSPSAAPTTKKSAKHDDAADPLQQALDNMSRLRRPEGMSFAEFTRLRQYIQTAAGAKAGLDALDRKDYVRARKLLSQAVAASPDDSRLVYSLALADLSGEKPDRQQGYWLLARAVNLAGGPAVARDVEEFGRRKYKNDGGTDRDWDQYLAVTAVPGANAQSVVASAPAQTPPVAVRTDTRPAQTASSRAETKAETKSAKVQTKSPKKEKQTEVASNREPASSRTGWQVEPEPPAESTAAANSLPPITVAGAPARRTGPPVSLGILVETAVTGKAERKAIVNSLSDMVRRLGPEDEAFILSFSNDLVFEEDLTGDTDRLESALDHIKPHPGTALLDAAGFAAGHLRRIAKNDTRVLLVISDGKNASSRIPALASSNEIRGSGVKIYCIGVDVASRDSMYRLQGLATGTGGTAAFITAPDQFRAAAQQIAGNIGIAFDY